MYTGPAVLLLVEQGVVGLDDPIAMHADPILEHLNGTKLADHFGHWINKVAVPGLLPRDLRRMDIHNLCTGPFALCS